MFAPRIAFIDVETTGASPLASRITEVGVVLVEELDGQWQAREWSSLVNPEMPIPPDISWLTGITNDMVRDAPVFSEIAPVLAQHLDEAILVAHNARFDHGFLKHAFERAGLPFSTKSLCTVRLSRALYPDRAPHSLDAVIARHGLPVRDRHRALGDARVLWEFIQAIYREHPAHDIEETIRGLLKRSGWPAHLSANVLTQIPKAPGVYLFHGLNAHPLYIGKSVNLRERIGSHFTNDYRTERALRLSQEVLRIEWEQTVGEMGALLRESALIKAHMPAHNVALRRQARQVVLECVDGADNKPRLVFLPLTALPLERPGVLYGVFGSRASAKATLIALAREQGLCLKVLGLERRRKDEPAHTPCFGFQVRRCQGCCVGAESSEAHWQRFMDLLAPMRLPDWPYPGPIAVIESDRAYASQDVHVFDRWCWLGTVKTLEAARQCCEQAGILRFEADVFKLLRTCLSQPSPACEVVSFTPAGAHIVEKDAFSTI